MFSLYAYILTTYSNSSLQNMTRKEKKKFLKRSTLIAGLETLKNDSLCRDTATKADSLAFSVRTVI